MFSKKKKETAKKDELKSTIDKDLIIHNMPKSLSRKKSSPFDVDANGSGSQDLIRGENDNFKKDRKSVV